jgi:hypothetical protein
MKAHWNEDTLWPVCQIHCNKTAFEFRLLPFLHWKRKDGSECYSELFDFRIGFMGKYIDIKVMDILLITFNWPR